MYFYRQIFPALVSPAPVAILIALAIMIAAAPALAAVGDSAADQSMPAAVTSAAAGDDAESGAPSAATDTVERPESLDTIGGFLMREMVVSARRENESLQDPPVFIETINMEKEAGRFMSTDEVVRQAAGVNVRQFGGVGSPSSVMIRGGGGDQVAVLLDGMKLNTSIGGGVDLSTVPTNQLKTIEVIRGGDSAFYGEGALGGVVNLVSKKPEYEPTTEIGVNYGSYNTIRGSATHSMSAGRFSYLLSAFYQHTTGNFRFINNNGTESNGGDDYLDYRENNDSDNFSTLIKGGWRNEGGLKIDLLNQFNYFERGVPGLVSFPSKHTREEEFRNSAAIRIAKDIDRLDLSSITSINYLYANNHYTDRRGEQTGVPIDNLREEHSPKIEEQLRYDWGEYQVWTFSLGYGYDQLIDPQFEDPSRQTFSVSARNRISLFDGSLIIVPATRYDYFSDIGGQYGQKLGLAYWPLDWLALKANGGRSYRAPNFSELYYNHGYLIGNEDLKPETSIGGDIGFQLHFPTIFVEAVYYRNYVDDLIEYVLISGLRYRPFNIGKAIIQGAETVIRYRPIKYFTFSASYTYTDAVDKTNEPNRSGNQIPGRPAHKAYVRFETLIADALSLYNEAHYIGENYITRANTKKLDARLIVNAGFTAQMIEQFKLGFEIKNLLNNREVDVRGFPLPDRTYFASAQFAF